MYAVSLSYIYPCLCSGFYRS